jgi:hypothetical protein
MDEAGRRGRVDMTRARRIALLNCADVILADVANGAEYLTQDPKTHETLPDRPVNSIEKEMKRIAARLRERAGE